MADKHLAQLCHDVTQLLGRRFVAETKNSVVQATSAPVVVSYLKLGELRIRNRDNRVVPLPDACRAHADILDCPVFVAKAAEIADSHGLVGEEDQATEKVLQGRSYRQRQDNAAHADTRHETVEWSAKTVAELKDDEQNGEDSERPGDEANKLGIETSFPDVL